MPKIGDEVDVAELNRIISTFPKDSFAVIEDVHAIFGSSAKATFEFGKIVGILEALLVANSIPFTKVAPEDMAKNDATGGTDSKKGWKDLE